MKGYLIKEELEQKYKELQSLSKVASYYGVSKKSILNYMNKFNLDRKSALLPLDIKKIVGMFNSGVKMQEIADTIGVSYVTVRRRLQAENIETDTFHKKYKIKESGYILIMAHDHPRADIAGYVPQHILVAEKTIGRYLKEDEVVHHKNRNKSDNTPSNLQVMKAYEHKSMHSSEARKVVDLKEVVRMIDNGYIFIDISKHFNISESGLRRKLQKEGLYRKLLKGTPSHRNNQGKSLI